MHRAISNYKITKRKDGRYYVRLQDGGEITHIYGKTKAEIQAKLEIKLEELNTLSRRRTEQAFPTLHFFHSTQGISRQASTSLLYTAAIGQTAVSNPNWRL